MTRADAMFSDHSPERREKLLLAAKYIAQEMQKNDPTGSGIVPVTPKEIARRVAEAIVDFDLTIEEGLSMTYVMGLYSKLE